MTLQTFFEESETRLIAEFDTFQLVEPNLENVLVLQDKLKSFLHSEHLALLEVVKEKLKEKRTSHGRLHGTIDCEPCVIENLLTTLEVGEKLPDAQ